MGEANNNKLHDSLHELSNDVSQLVIREQQLLNEELLRMGKLLHEVAAELRQCFTTMGQQLDQQSALLRQTHSGVMVERRRNPGKEEMLLATSELGAYVGRAIRSLQFEDILRQIIEHSRRRALEIEKMFVALQGRIDDTRNYEERDLEQVLVVLESCHREIAAVREALTLANPARQQSMGSGDVTLF